MGDLRKPGICIFLYAVFALSSAFISIADAAMPSYQRLSPITSPVYSPTDVAVDSNGNIYVVESINNKLIVFSQSKTYIRSLLGLSKPICVAVDNSGRVYIGNKTSMNVAVYDADLNYLFKLGTGDGEFLQPNSIAIDSSSGNIFVVDMKSDVIKVYGSSGGHLFSFDGTLNGGGLFHEPTSLIIDSGEILVLDHPLTPSTDDPPVGVNGARIQFFEMDGGYNNGFNKYGTDLGDMRKPVHLGTDNEGRIYVSDSEFSIIRVYDRTGEYLGAVYDNENPLRSPVGITITGGNILYIASLGTHKVESYGITPFALMEIDPLSLSWEEQRGGNPSLQNVLINNNGDRSLSWAAAADSSWITLSDTNGTSGPGSTSGLNIGVDLLGLPAGNYTGSVSISAEFGAAEVISIELSLQDVLLIANPGGPYSVTEGQLIQLDGSSSSGAVVLYEWDIDDNGSYDYSFSEPLYNHLFVNSDTYQVRLRITDDLDATHNALVNVTVLDSLPTADFTASPTYGGAPHTVDFANNSTGYDQPLTYEWDFDNDGTIDSTVANPSYVYNIPGEYSVKLTVTDSDLSDDSLIKTNYLAVTDESGCADSNLKNGTAEYVSIQNAYNAALDGDVILIRNVVLNEQVVFDRDITVTLSGGYNCDYTVREGKTVINGNITISNGVLVLKDIILE